MIALRRVVSPTHKTDVPTIVAVYSTGDQIGDHEVVRFRRLDLLLTLPRIHRLSAQPLLAAKQHVFQSEKRLKLDALPAG